MCPISWRPFPCNNPSFSFVSHHSPLSSGCEPMPSWCQCREQLNPTWGTNLELYPATNFMKLVKAELVSMSQVTREGSGWTWHHVSFASSARWDKFSRVNWKRPSKIQKKHALLSASVLLSSGFLQAEKERKAESSLKKNQFAAH